MSDADDVIPAPTSLPEVGIHLSYIRRDIRKVGQTVEDGFKSLDDKFVSHAEFQPVAETVGEHSLSIKSLESSRDNMNGKLIGFGVAISLASGVFTFVITHWPL